MQKDIFSPDQYLKSNELALVPSGEPFFIRAIQIIDKAEHLIHLQMYIFDADETGRAVVEALKRARQRGVDIYMNVDSYGSKSLSPAFIADLQHSGIHFKLFSPLPKHYFIFRLGRRLHTKVIVVDQEVGLVGGINIADKYRGTDQEIPWLDFAIYVKGPVCIDLSHICERIYREKYFGKFNIIPRTTKNEQYGNACSRLVINDWFRRKNQIGAGYLSAFGKAKTSITVMASYFLPSRSLRVALKRAARRGVQVNLLLPGKSDINIAKRATTYLYRWLLRNNIGIYEWRHSILHGKLAVVDDKWVTIGSYNLNHLSKYSSIELNIEVLDEDFATNTRHTLSALMLQSTAVTNDTYGNKRSHLDKLLDWASYVSARWIMLFLFFLIKRDQGYKETA